MLIKSSILAFPSVVRLSSVKVVKRSLALFNRWKGSLNSPRNPGIRASFATRSGKMTSVGVGIGVFAVRKSDGKFVVGERMGSTGAGTLALPGGHLEFLESFSTCAIRETLEETALNLELSSMTQVTAINSPMPLENKHYVTIFMRGTCVDENPTPINLEVNKCKGWRWISWEELVAISEDPSQSLFLPLRNLIKERGKDFHPLR